MGQKGKGSEELAPYTASRAGPLKAANTVTSIGHRHSSTRAACGFSVGWALVVAGGPANMDTILRCSANVKL